MVRPEISLALPPSRRIVEYSRAAERLGYHRVWVYDSPALYGDIWIALARVAEATQRIGVGTGVAIPSLRHPMVTASAIASVEDLAPGRLVAAFGTGFTGRKAMGKPAMKWAEVATYVRQLRGLLDGEIVEIEGVPCQMLHAAGWAPPRPITTPLWLAPSGPKGHVTAQELDIAGVIVPMVPEPHQRTGKPTALLTHGTIVRPGEDHTTPRLVGAAGPWFATLSFHGLWDMYPDLIEQVPGGTVWRDAMLAARPPEQRHLAVHEGHITVITERDRPAVTAAGPAILGTGWTGDAATVATRIHEAGEAGVTEIVYAPAAPDIIDELEAFMSAASGGPGHDGVKHTG
jgi:5,10-methylenetetrahydromethanopterin reductase